MHGFTFYAFPDLLETGKRGTPERPNKTHFKLSTRTLMARPLSCEAGLLRLDSKGHLLGRGVCFSSWG